MKALVRDVIRADIRRGLSDDEATQLYYDSNLNQQSFADFSYTQKIEAIKYYDAFIRNNSHQGRRNDLLEKTDEESEDETCVQTRHKTDKKSRRALPEIKWHDSLVFPRLHSASIGAS